MAVGGHALCLCHTVVYLVLMLAAASFQCSATFLTRGDDGWMRREPRHDSNRVLAATVNNTKEADQQVLLEFQRGLTGDLLGWNPARNPDICSWEGVQCDQSGNVSALNLTSKRLVGTISPSIGNLSFLSSLVLADNFFSGGIPTSLGMLKHLRVLDFSRNNLSQTIPSQISNCSSLTYLNLSKNSLAGSIPPSLGRLLNITQIDLTNNKLTLSIPSSLGNCSLLQHLDLSSNLLTEEIPYELGRLRWLESLQLFSNNLTGSIPRSISNCSSLAVFYLYRNQLTGEILPELGLLGRLTDLVLSRNHLTGPIPASIGNLSSLTHLALGYSPLSGPIPPELGKLQSLQRMWLVQANTTGTIPHELGKLSNLTELWLFNMYLTGTIPPALGNLTNLISFRLNGNNLQGKIQAWLGKFGRLGWLDLSSNSLTGGVPAELGNMTSIWKLGLSDNHLGGPVIPDLGRLHTLQILSLDQNWFSEGLPVALGNISGLQQLFVYQNNLSGHILPDMVAKMKEMYDFRVSINQFSGLIPDAIGQMISLQVIDLSFNNFSGPIPSTIENCLALNFIDFSNNRLTGRLPLEALESLQSLQNFSVANNNLEGRVPPSVGGFANVTAEDYAGNADLCGPLLGKNCSTPPSAEKVSCHGISSGCHRKWIYVASAVPVLLLAVLVFLCVFCCRKLREIPSGYDEDNVPEVSLFTKELALSVDDLRKATDGFGTYNILGVGGYSTVYKATLPEHDGRIIAVKCLNSDAGSTKSEKSQLLHELRILGNLKHRNLVKLYGVCFTPVFKALLLEYVAGGSLQLCLHPEMEGGMRSCPLNLESRIRIAVGVANAMVYLHHEARQPVIHRDLKTSNILLDGDLNAKVVDFGISKFVNRSSNGEASVSGLSGSIGYIPPEYASTVRVSTKGDVYSFGIVLLELITGKSPTDDDFGKEDTLVEWVFNAFPDRVFEILDDTVRKEFAAHEWQLQLLVRVGLLCTQSKPRDRPSMKDVQVTLMQAKYSTTESGGIINYPTLIELAEQPTATRPPGSWAALLRQVPSAILRNMNDAHTIERYDVGNRSSSSTLLRDYWNTDSAREIHLSS